MFDVWEGRFRTVVTMACWEGEMCLDGFSFTETEVGSSGKCGKLEFMYAYL